MEHTLRKLIETSLQGRFFMDGGPILVGESLHHDATRVYRVIDIVPMESIHIGIVRLTVNSITSGKYYLRKIEDAVKYDREATIEEINEALHLRKNMIVEKTGP